MTVAVVNTAKSSTYAQVMVTGAFSSTTGNHISVFIRIYNTNTVSSVVDTAGNTYTLQATGPNFDPSLWVYTAENITGNAANVVTVTLSSSIAFVWIYAVECSGVATSSATDFVSASKTGSGTTDLVSDSFSTTAAGIVLVGVSQNNTTDYTAGTDFTLLDGAFPGVFGSDFGGIEAYVTSGVLSSYTAHFTSTVTNQYNMAVLALKGAGGSSANFFPAIVMGRAQSLVF